MTTLSLQSPVIIIIAAALLISFSSSISAMAAANPDVQVALGEMQNANYFAYAMLINMAPPDLIQANITLLMPNDRTLSRANVAEDSVTDFLLRHSIPWPLLFDHMEHFPTGSLIPTSRPELVLKVVNDGRQRLFFNNVRVVSPNICTKGASIRCHGIDGVVQPSLLSDSCPPHNPRTLPSQNGAGNATQTSPPPSPLQSHPPQSVEDDIIDSPPKSGSHSSLTMRNNTVVVGFVSILAMMICLISGPCWP